MKKVKNVFASVPCDHWTIAALFILFAIILGYREWYHEQRFARLEQEINVTADTLHEAIAETHATLAADLDRERNNLSSVQNELGNFRNVVVQEVGSLSGTVGTLEKLSKTDPELLQKYSKVFFLSEHYAPERLAAIDKKYLYTESRPESIHASVAPKLKNLLDAAAQAGITLYVKSAYRSFDEQKSLKGAYSVTYGSGANTFSADQGYSEHQLGTTLDFITSGLGGQLNGFEKTTAYQWLLSNAWRYGFILSYPEGNQYYIFEPWHWRYVGTALAAYLNQTGKRFYELDQREIDTYLVNIFD